MEKVRIGGVPEHFNYPWHLAINNKEFAKHSIELIWSDYSTGTGAMCNDLENNKLDLAIILSEGAVNALSKSNTFKIIKIYIDSPLLWGIHVTHKSDIHNIDQIQDKTYAISRLGSGSHLMAYVDAKARNWNTQNLTFSIVNNMQGAAESFEKGESSVFFWEKFTTQPMVDSGDFRLLDIRPTPWPCFVLVARTEFLEQKISIVESITSIINQSAEYVQNNPAESIKGISEMYKLNPEAIEEWFKLTKWNTNLQIKTSDIIKIGDSLYDLSLISNNPNPQTICSSITQLV